MLEVFLGFLLIAITIIIGIALCCIVDIWVDANEDLINDVYWKIYDRFYYKRHNKKD